MLDGVSLDQLRTFIAAADEGSFSAAGRRLRRAQSVVSQVLANLEGQLGVKLFDRSARFPVLTNQGRALLANARTVAGDVDLFRGRRVPIRWLTVSAHGRRLAADRPANLNARLARRGRRGSDLFDRPFWRNGEGSSSAGPAMALAE